MKTLKVGEPWGDDPLKYDLSELMEKGDWKWAIVRQPKDKTVTLRMQGSLIDSVKQLAKAEGVAYQSLMRDLIAQGVSVRQMRSPVASEKLKMSYPKTKKKKKA